MAGVRWVVAGTLLVAFFQYRGDHLPPRTAWSSIVVRGILLICFGNGAVVWAEQTVPSGLTSILVALSPFWMVGVESVVGETQALKGSQLIGLLTGFGGVMLLIWPQLGTDLNARGTLTGFLCTQLA